MNTISTYGEQAFWRMENLDFSKSFEQMAEDRRRTIRRVPQAISMPYYKAKLDVVWAGLYLDEAAVKTAYKKMRKIRRVIWKK